MKIEANPLMNHAANLMLLLIGMESLCSLICTSFGLPFTRLEGLLLVAVCILMWISASFRFGPLLGVPMCALLLFFYFRQNGQSLAESAQALATQIVGTYTRHFGGSSPLAAEDTPSLSFPAFFLIMSLLSAFVSFSLTSGSFRVSLVRIATIPLFFACVLINGNLPVIPALGCLVFWLGLQLSGDSFRTTDGSGRAFALGILPCILVLVGLLLIYRPSTYRHDDQENAFPKQIARIGDLFSDWLGSGSQSSGTASLSADGASLQMSQSPAGWFRDENELKLDIPFDYSALNQTAMTVHVDVSGTLYLRGRSYGEYTGTAWTAAIEDVHASALNYTASALSEVTGQETNSFEIETTDLYGIFYLPYYTSTPNKGDISVVSDGSINYRGDFRHYPGMLPPSLRLPSELVQEELQYRQFAASYYTRLPETTREALSQICEEHSFSKDQEDILNRIADYVRSIGIYDLSVSGSSTDDWVVSFLTDSHRGYCIHYASAAVALYRYLGIPARICEGYMLNAVPNSDIRVTGENAHAWAEVYLDGTGWVPVEVTASAGDYSGDPAFTSETLTENVPSPASAENEEGISQSETSTEEDSLSPDDTPSDPAEESSEDSQSKASGNASYFLNVLVRVLSVPALIIFLFFARFLLLSYIRSQRFTSADTNQKIILLYQDAQRLKLYGADIPDTVSRLAEKAAFSQHQIQAEEVATCIKILTKLSQDTYSSLNIWRRFLFRYYHVNYYNRSK